MANRIANGMAIAMAIATEPFMAHSTPLLTTTSLPLFVVLDGSDQIQSDRHLGRIGLGDLR